jgi:integrase/recombinase XerD
MIQDMQLRNFAPGTIAVYVHCAPRYARHFGKSPEALGPDDVLAYLLQLVQERRPSWSYDNQNLHALRFLDNVTLGHDWVLKHIACPKQPKRLPVVLSPDELTRSFAAVGGLEGASRRPRCSIRPSSRGASRPRPAESRSRPTC